tara:strand:+ start:208 stop:696 length:489 start_codon:yes stop_codon:yes gene_type:complete
MRLLLISIFFVGLAMNITFLNTFPIFANTYLQEEISNNQLAQQYCDSLGKNLFTGLEKESALKYEYFFSAIPDNSIKDKNKFLKKFKSDVKSICSYEISKSNEKEFDLFLKNYFKTRNNTPKIKVEATKPTPTNPAIIPVFRKTFTVANSLPSFLAMIFLLK